MRTSRRSSPQVRDSAPVARHCAGVWSGSAPSPAFAARHRRRPDVAPARRFGRCGVSGATVYAAWPVGELRVHLHGCRLQDRSGMRLLREVGSWRAIYTPSSHDARSRFMSSAVADTVTIGGLAASRARGSCGTRREHRGNFFSRPARSRRHHTTQGGSEGRRQGTERTVSSRPVAGWSPFTVKNPRRASIGQTLAYVSAASDARGARRGVCIQAKIGGHQRSGKTAKARVSAQQPSLIAYLAADRELGITRWEAPAPLTTPRRPA